jgi:uncharacterized protein YhjY with autotransporter beta-barrel domain
MMKSSRCTPLVRALHASVFLGLLAAALPAPAAAAQQFVVVRKTGQASSYTTQAKVTASPQAACSDDSVAFAFTVEPRDGAVIELERSGASSRDVLLDVALSCSSLSGTAIVSFDASGGTAVRGTDYLSVPGTATLDLTSALQSTGGVAPVVAAVRINVLDNPQASTSPVSLSIVRREGSFQGQWPGGSPVVGTIPGSNDAIVAVTIAGRVTIRDAAEVVPGIDDAASEISVATTEFCRGNGGGAGRAGCVQTQRAADLVADLNTPTAVREAASTVLENNLLAIAPDETTALAFVAPRLATGQRDNLAVRLNAMRTGDQSGKLSASGLNFVSNGLPVSLSALPMILGVDDDESAANEEKRTLLGGTRLGFWINGTIGASERDRRRGNSGFESDTWEVTSGLDYRFTDKFFAGAALGFSNLDLDYQGGQGSLDVDARALHFYAGYALDNGLSFDGSLSYMRSDYDQRRAIELLELDASGMSYHSLGRAIARGETTVTQRSGSVGATWTVMRDTWTFAPQAQFSMLRTVYDAFSETGPSEFNLRYGERSGKAHSFSFGSYVDRTYATSVGAFRPYGRLLYFIDSGKSKDLLAEFVLANQNGTNTPISFEMNVPDQRYGTAELGLAFSRPIGTRTVDFNVAYMQMFSFMDFDRWALRFDVRFPL